MTVKEKLLRFARLSNNTEAPAQNSQTKLSYELLTLPLPFVLWFVTFIHPLIGFWPMLALSTFVLFAVSLPRIRNIVFKPTLRGVLIGAASGVFLFTFFYFGARIANSIYGFPAQVSAVYSFRGNFPLSAIAVLLLFPIGPAEALYWQGLILRHLDSRLKPWKAVILTSFLYVMIHLPTLNPSLMLVSLVVGLSWGFLYNKLGKNLFPVLLSHVIFDEFAFVLFMIA